VVTLAHTFESGQPNGTSISPANSGVGGNAFDAASAGAGGTLVYDNAPPRGALCAQATTGAGAVAASASWTTAIGTAIAREYGRMTVHPGALTTATVVHRARGAGAQAFRIVLNTSGIWELRNNTSSLLVSASGAMSTSDTWRIAWDILVGASVTGVLYIYHDPTSAVPDETLTANSANFGTNNIDESNFGVVIAASNCSVRFDDIVCTDVALPGPAQQSIAVSESVTAGETITRGLVLPRGVAETVAAADSPVRSLALPRSLAEAFAVADNPGRVLALPRGIGEAAHLADHVDLILVPAGGLNAGSMRLASASGTATPSTRSAQAATATAAGTATTSTAGG